MLLSEMSEELTREEAALALARGDVLYTTHGWVKLVDNTFYWWDVDEGYWNTGHRLDLNSACISPDPERK